MKTEPELGSSEGAPSDHQLHVASVEPHPIKKSLWQRWMAWSGSFLIISILLHVVLLGGATVLVVQVVQGRKEKLKFTAPPPSAAGAAEHKVKASKKTAAAAPAISKRITSTAANASVALPAMDMSSSTGPDVMASVMSGMGASGLGSGAGGVGGMASMPLAGLTAFGFKGGGRSDGLVGRLYDLKQTKDKQETDIKDDGFWKNPKQLDGMGDMAGGEFKTKVLNDPSKHALISPSMLNEAKVINDFLGNGWDEKILLKYYRSQDPMVAYQWSFPLSTPKDAVKAFGVQNEVKPTHILIHYKGFVTAPRDCTVRFRCLAWGGLMAVRFDGMNVMVTGLRNPLLNLKSFEFVDTDPNYDKGKGVGYSGHTLGRWMNVQAGKKYPIEIFLNLSESSLGVGLMIEEKNPATPYQPSEWQWQSNQGKQYQTGDSLKTPYILLRYPLFALKKGIPPAPFKFPSTNIPGPEAPAYLIQNVKRLGHFYVVPDVAQEPMIFPGAK